MQERIWESVSKAKLLVGLIIVVCTAVLVVYWPSLSANALSFDDEQYFTENLLVQSPGWKSAWRFLTEVLEPSTVNGYYQPLTMISLMVDYALGGQADNLMPFHRTSLALHLANTALVIILLYMLFGNIWAAAGIGLLFGIHPMTVETIAWVGERKTLLAAFFAFWCLILYVGFAHKKNPGFYLGCMAMYTLALMSKPTSTPLPIMMLLMDYWPLKRLNRRTVLEKIPLFVVGAVSAVITYISQSRTATVGLPTEYGPERIPLVICHNIVFYLYKIIWPINLSSHYPYPAVFSLSNPTLMAGIIGSCVLILLLIISLRWTRAALTGCLIFFVALLPTMQIIGFSNVIAADKFAYLPSVGLLMILAAFAAWVYSVNETLIWHIVIVIVVLISAGAESVGTRKHLVHWRSTMSLSKYFLAQSPDATQTNLMMGYAFQREGKLDEAETYYRRAVRISPSAADVHNNLALTLRLQGKFDEAADQYRQALQGEPNNANIHYNLGNTLQSLGKLDEAINQYYEALRIKPEHAYAHNNLANALSEQGKLDEAVNHYRQALKIKPLYPGAYNNLGTTLQMQGKLEEAIDCYNRALRIKPDFSEAHYNLIYALALQNKLDVAINYYRQVLHIDIEDAEAYNLFGIGLQSRGEFDKAVGQFQNALQAKPDFVEAHRNLAMLFESQGKFEEAAIHYRKILQLKPDDIELHTKIGNLLASQNKLDEAIGHFGQAVRLEPNNAEAHYNMGVALAMAEAPREAIEHLKQAMQLKPSWYEPAILLAGILATCPDSEVRDPNSAVRIAMQAADLTKHQDPVVLEALAVSYAAAGQFEMAVKAAQEALALASATQDNELVNRLRDMIEQYKQGHIKDESAVNAKTDVP
jgi:tetratricopeptide (TPR) repeat protein